MPQKPTYEELEQRVNELEKENSDFKRMDDALKNRIVALTLPLEDDGNIAFEDLFNIDDIQRIQDEFAKVTGVASIITHTDGTPITAPSNFCRLCKDIIRKTDKGLTNCFKSDAVVGRFHPGGPIIQPCMSGGLWDAGAGITIGGRHIANWLIGQVRDELQTEDKILAYAREIGASEKGVVEAFREVTAMSREQFGQIAKFLFTLANQLSTTAYQNVQQARFITERKRAEDAIQESENKFKGFAEQALTGLYLMQDGVLKYVNPKFAEMFGYTVEELLNDMLFSKLAYAEDVALVEEQVRRRISGEVQFAFYTFRGLKKNGQIFHVEVYGSSIVYKGNPAGIGTILDITERKQSEEKLRETQSILQAAMDNNQAGIAIADSPSGSLRYVNDAGLLIRGGDRQSVVNGVGIDQYVASWQLLDFDGRPLRTDEVPLARAIMFGEICTREFIIRRAEGDDRIVWANASPITNDAGNITAGVVVFLDITERKQAEEMLKLQMAIMETVAEGIFLIGLEDNIIKWTNSKFEQLFGYGPGEMVGMHVDKVNAPTEMTPTETRLSIVDILRQTGEWHGEIKSIKKNGTHFWSYIHVSLFNHPEFGTVMVSAHTDITDRKQAETALQESELRFRTMADAIPQMAWIARADGYIFWYNQRWYDYTGTAPEQMEGWGWQNVHDPNVLPEVLERWQVSLETSEPFDMTFPLRGADGVFRPFLTRVIPLKNNAGRVMQWFGTNTDISELKRVEQALRESEALYRSIGESIDYGVWICEPDGRNTYASESFLKMVGITQEQCSNFGWGDVLHPDDAERTITAWQECVRTGGTWDIEHRFRGTDGQWHHVLARGVPVRNEQGKIINWAGINLDINRIKQAEEQIRASLAEKEVLLKEIHHRVKNNLQVISSLISLQADCLADEQMQGVLGDMRDRVRTMALVHEKLYQTENLARLDFAEYAHSLLKYIWDSHSPSNGKVRLNILLSP